MLDPQTLQRPPGLRRLRAADLAARCRRVKIMRAPIRIKAQRQAMRAKHLGRAARKVEAVPSSSTRNAE